MASSVTVKRFCLWASAGRSHAPSGGALRLAGSSVALGAKRTGPGQTGRRPWLDTPGASTSSAILYSQFYLKKICSGVKSSAVISATGRLCAGMPGVRLAFLEASRRSLLTAVSLSGTLLRSAGLVALKGRRQWLQTPTVPLHSC